MCIYRTKEVCVCVCVEQRMCVHVHRTKEVVYVSECVCFKGVYSLNHKKTRLSKVLPNRPARVHHCACSVTFEGVHSHTHKTQDY